MSATTLPRAWRSLADRIGGVSHLAAELGVTESTIWRWAHGRHPCSKSTHTVLAMLAKQHSVAVPRVAVRAVRTCA